MMSSPVLPRPRSPSRRSTGREAWIARRQLERDRERLMNLEMLELAAVQGEKTREYVELLRQERHQEELEA